MVMFPPPRIELPCKVCGEPCYTEGESAWFHLHDYDPVMQRWAQSSIYNHPAIPDALDVQEALPAYQGDNPWDTYEHNKGDENNRARARRDVFKHKAAPPQPMRPPEF